MFWTNFFVNFNSKYWFCDLDTFPLFASQLVPCDQWRLNQACLGHVSSIDLNKTIKDRGIIVGFWIIKVMTPIWNYLLSFVHLGIINTFESSKSISSFEITLWPQYTLFIKDHTSPWKYFWIIEDCGDLQNPYIHLKPPVADIKRDY